MSKRTGGYVQAPEVPEELWRRLRLIQQVGAGRMTVTEAARLLGLSRVRMQSLVHRGEASMVEALRPKPAGRPRRPEAERVREQELKRLRRENEKLQAKLGKMEHVLLTAAELMQGRILESRQVWARERKRKPAGTGERRVTPRSPTARLASWRRHGR